MMVLFLSFVHAKKQEQAENPLKSKHNWKFNDDEIRKP